jgi:hypothetical protein
MLKKIIHNKMVDITNGGLSFSTDLDSSGFEQGANKLISKEAEIRQAVADGAKQQKFYSDEMLGMNSQQVEGINARIKAAVNSTQAIKVEGLSIKELNEELRKQQSLAQNTGDTTKIAKYNQTIQQTQGEISRLQNVGKSGFDDLGNAVAETTKKTGGFVSGVNTAFGAVRKLAYILPGIGIAGILAFLATPIIEYISKLDIFTDKSKAAVEGQRALAKEMGKAGEAAGKATIAVDLQKQAFDQSRKAIITKTEALKLYNDGIGKTLGYTNDINIAEERTLKNGDALIELMFKKAKAAALANLYQEQIAEQAKIDAKSDGDAGSFILSGTNGKSAALSKLYQKGIQRNKDTEKAPFVEKANAFKNLMLDTYNDIRIFAKKNGLSVEDLVKPPKGKSDENFLNAQRALQQKVNAIGEEYARKSLSKDEAEVQAVRDKFKKIADEVAKFNANPKNKYKVDGSSLDGTRDKAIEDLRYKQDTAKFGVQLEEQKKIYAAYETFKTTFGEEAANVRFAKELELAKTTAEKEAKELAGLATKMVVGGGLNNNQQERFNLLTKDLKAQSDIKQAQQDKDLAEALKAAKSHAEKLVEIDEDYEKNVKALGENASDEQIAILKKDRDAQKSSVNEEYAYAQSGYADLMENLLDMTKKAAIERLREMKKGYLTGDLGKDLTPAQKGKAVNQIDSQIDSLDGTNNNPFQQAYKGITEYREALKNAKTDSIGLADAQSRMFNGIAAGAQAANSIFGDVTGALSNLGIGNDKYTQATLKSIQGLLGGVGDLAKGLASGNPVDIIKGSISILTSAIELFNTKDKKLEHQIDAYKADLASLQKAYAELDKAVQNSVGDSYYTDSAKEIENLKQQQQDLIKSRDAENAKKKTDGNKINEYNKQIDAIPDKIEAVKKAISQNLIQGSFKDLSNSLADALTTAFQAGQNGIASMDASLNSFIGNAIKNSLKLKLIEPIIKSLTDDLVKYAQGNNNSIVGFDFKSYKDKLNSAGKTFSDALNANQEFFVGTAANASSSSSNSLSGAIKGITAPQADLLAGQFGGLRLAQLELTKVTQTNHFELMQANTNKLNNLIKIEANTGRTANNTDRLANMELALASINSKMGKNADALGGAGKI